MAHVSQRAALHADGMHLRHFVGNGAQGGDRAEGDSFVVHVKSGNDNPHPIVRQPVADLCQSFVQKLCLVDADDIYIGGKEENVAGRVNRCRRDGVAVVADHIFVRIACINGRLEDFHLLSGKLRPLHTPDKLFGFAGEHTSTNHFYAPLPTPFTVEIVHRCHKFICKFT